MPWKESLKQLCDLGLKEEVTRKILRDNAIDLFKLKVEKGWAADVSSSFVVRPTDALGAAAHQAAQPQKSYGYNLGFKIYPR